MWASCAFLLVATSVAISAKTVSVPQRAENEDPYRLPKTVLPESYALTIIAEYNFALTGDFSGSVSIAIRTVEDVEEITLHARFLEINEDKVELTCGNTTNLFESLRNETDYHTIFVKAQNVIPAGTSCTLKFGEYTGKLMDDMNGFYRSSYQNENGETE